MDEATRELVQAAIALDDATRRDHDAWEYRRRAAEPPPAMVYKTFERPAPQQPQSTDLDEATMARWNAWFDERLHSVLYPIFELHCTKACENDDAQAKLLRKEFAAEIAKLELRLQKNPTSRLKDRSHGS